MYCVTLTLTHTHTYTAPLGMSLNCTETWQAYAPAVVCKEEKQIITLKKLTAAEGGKNLHSRCLRAELEVLARVPPHPHILNLLGVCTTAGRPTLSFT